jgi:hypothetical protein
LNRTGRGGNGLRLPAGATGTALTSLGEAAGRCRKILQNKMKLMVEKTK